MTNLGYLVDQFKRFLNYATCRLIREQMREAYSSYACKRATVQCGSRPLPSVPGPRRRVVLKQGAERSHLLNNRAWEQYRWPSVIVPNSIPAHLFSLQELSDVGILEERWVIYDSLQIPIDWQTTKKKAQRAACQEQGDITMSFPAQCRSGETDGLRIVLKKTLFNPILTHTCTHLLPL